MKNQSRKSFVAGVALGVAPFLFVAAFTPPPQDVDKGETAKVVYVTGQCGKYRQWGNSYLLDTTTGERLIIERSEGGGARWKRVVAPVVEKKD